ncbi:hypothetical protein MFLAVUS_002214 [Mucor flavus]|uniref:Uncharacterized protein n=1 Tax=Mucor flavus TaxID=439312 RepID=A0ABP9YPP3_9FUNG
MHVDQSRHPDSDGNLVRMNDVVFSIHGFVISLFILLQTCVYKKHETQKISSFAAAFVWLACMGAVLVVSTIHYGGAIWLDFMYYLSSVKLIVSFIKYLPQVWINYKRKSTQGWSVQYIIWYDQDLSGGVLSIIQLLLDAYIDGDWSGIEGDNVKLHQHFIAIPQERRSLLVDSRVPIEQDDGNSVSSYNSSINRRPINANRNYGSTNISLYAASV